MPSPTDAAPVTVHADAGAMAESLAQSVAADLARAVAERGEAVFAVSGGSTPAALYRELSKAAIDWPRVTVVLVDERWVDPGEAGSNESFVRKTLLTGPAANAGFVGLKTPDLSPLEAVDAVERRLEGVPHAPDIVILGMGPDGHTASWFPRAQGLDRALTRNGTRVAAVQAAQTDVTGPHTQRMTLTFGAVAQARRLVLMISGRSKRDALEQALQDGPVADMPVRALLRDEDLPLEIHWTD